MIDVAHRHVQQIRLNTDRLDSSYMQQEIVETKCRHHLRANEKSARDSQKNLACPSKKAALSCPFRDGDLV